MSLFHLLEPEETIGNLWHRLVGNRSSVPQFPDAAVHSSRRNRVARVLPRPRR